MRRSGPSRALTGVLCVLLVLGSSVFDPGPAARQRQKVNVEESTGETAPPPEPLGGGSSAQFREDLIQYLRESEQTIARALQNPVIGAELQARMSGSVFQLPIAPEIYQAIESLDLEQLDALRLALEQSSASLEAPAALSYALDQLDRHPVSQEPVGPGLAGAAGFANSCGTNYEEWAKVVSKKETTRALIRAQGPLKLTAKVAEKVADALRAALEDIPVIGSKLVIIFHVVWGVTNITQAALGISISVLDLQITESELCLASCLSDSADAAHPNFDSSIWRGKGCDNRDNNCEGAIDEAGEDKFKPELFVDSSALLRCYASHPEADAAARRAVTAQDDCRLSGSPAIDVAAGACAATATVQARDAAGNTSTPLSFSLKVDGAAPVIGAPALSSCYPTMAAARGALAATSVSDPGGCSSFSTRVKTAEKECVANLTLEAVDECGNRSSSDVSVRIDDASPEVQIETLKIPSVNGLACFPSEAAAAATVRAATRYSDNCTSTNDLAFSTATSGNACNLTVTSAVTDECSGVTTAVSADALLVRVDTEPPAISCTVATPVLWPATDELVDIGFQLNLADNCDPQPALDVIVTSDESTRYAYVTSNGNDPFPDAVIERTAAGGIQRILLRAQRRTTNTASYDGRVYRIRVVATDACGLSRSTECWAEVPSTSNSTSVNSGQNYDATTEN